MLAFILALALGGAAQTSIEAEWTPPYDAIAVMPLTSLGSTDDAAQVIQRVLLGEFRKLLGHTMIAPVDLHAKAGFAGEYIDACEGVVPCLVEVFGALGWDAFVVGTIAGLGDDRVTNLKLIDVRMGATVRRASERASGDETVLIRHMRHAAVSVIAPDLLTGTLTLAVKQNGVRIIIDGDLIGTTPLRTRSIVLPAGKHAIEASGTGLQLFSQMLELSYGESKTLKIVLPENTDFLGGNMMFRERWWPWAVAGMGVVAAGLGGYFNYQHAFAVKKIQNKSRNNKLDSNLATDLYHQKDANWQRAQVMYGTGGGLMGVAAMLFTVDLL